MRMPFPFPDSEEAEALLTKPMGAVMPFCWYQTRPAHGCGLSNLLVVELPLFIAGNCGRFGEHQYDVYPVENGADRRALEAALERPVGVWDLEGRVQFEVPTRVPAMLASRAPKGVENLSPTVVWPPDRTWPFIALGMLGRNVESQPGVLRGRYVARPVPSLDAANAFLAALWVRVAAGRTLDPDGWWTAL